MIKNIPTWWSKGPHPGNVGDILTPLIMDKLFKVKCIYTKKPFNTPTLLGAGSIISHAENRSIVWGSGLMRTTDQTKRDARYLAVRGPRTYETLRERQIPCDPIFGDPVLLMPKIFKVDNISKSYEFGLFTHYVDYETVSKWYKDDSNITVINPLNANPLMVISKVLQCEKIISSSLHGIIIAHAYGIPAVWVKHSDKLNGDGTKFHDYFESVKMKGNCIDFQQKIHPSNFSKFNYLVGIDIDLIGLEQAMWSFLYGK
jgi:hypothetical protein